jgi:hypothetical protein
MNYLTKLDIKSICFVDILIIILILCIDSIKLKIKKLFNDSILRFIKYFSSEFTSIEIQGCEFIKENSIIFEYPYNMIAINYYVFSKNKSNKFRYFNERKNGLFYVDDIKDTLTFDGLPNYILSPVTNIQIDDNILLTMTYDDIEFDSKNNSIKQLTLKLSSKNNIEYIQNFIHNCICNYEDYIDQKNKDKTYHFIYQGKKEGKLKFSTKLISDFSNPELENYETFNNIFHSNKEKIINDIKKLKDNNYYKRTGQKRKKGYLFYGHPGTGKTSTVMAISNYDKRHIIEVQLDRVKTNSEFEEILSLDKINNIKIKQNNTILFFDEIDIDTKLNRNIETQFEYPIKSNSKKISKDFDDCDIQLSIPDKLSLSTILSRFDGIGNYSGLIIIAATNDISKIDSSIYRDGRLNLMKFDYATCDDIKNMIEKYYDINLSNELIKKISNLNSQIAHASLRVELEKYNTPELFIDSLISIS